MRADVQRNQMEQQQHSVHPGMAPAFTQLNAVFPGIFPGSVFLRGYDDCIAETFHYLTQVEGLPLDHPIITGLYKHMQDQEDMLIQQMQYFYGVPKNNSQSGACYPEQIPNQFNKTNSTSNDNSKGNPEASAIYATHGEQPLNSYNDIYPQLDTSLPEECQQALVLPDFNTLNIVSQTNPTVAVLTQELLMLLDEDNTDSDVEEYYDNNV